MQNRITVHRDEEVIYDIVFAQSFDRLAEEVKKLVHGKQKLCIVTDSNVAPLYLAEVESKLGKCSPVVIHHIIPAGEEHKNLDIVKTVYETLIQNHFDRNDLLVALGGGVVGDLCGFTAATYLRGVSFIQIPTTLLSQVDSSIGGKTGVDFDAYKNMVGAFHMPKLVYSNAQTLLTLPEEQFASGMGEIIKHGLIVDREYYRWLEEHRGEIQSRNLEVCQQMIIRSDEIKRRVVEEDPTEQGVRSLLNFGHTLGHAIEKLKNFTMLHGHCVAVGCIGAAYISQQRGMIAASDVEDMISVMEHFGLPVTVSGLNIADIVETTKSDKKMDAGVIKFVLLKQIGQAYVDRTVTEDEMSTALSMLVK